MGGFRDLGGCLRDFEGVSEILGVVRGPPGGMGGFRLALVASGHTGRLRRMRDASSSLRLHQEAVGCRRTCLAASGCDRRL